MSPKSTSGTQRSVVRDQIAFFGSLICTDARWNPAACGTHQGDRERCFARTLRARELQVFWLRSGPDGALLW